MERGNRLHIAVEGCVGVGKTTLATRLASARKSTLVLEEFEKNPFLEEFYSNPTENVFETEMQFLLLHYHQLKRLSKTRETITDFTFIKDIVFAETNIIDMAEKEMFIELYQFLLARLPKPDLIIYLKGSEDLIIERIRRRNRTNELKTDVAYFKKLKRAYDAFFSSYEGRIHFIDAEHFDFLNSPHVLDEVCKIIDSSPSGKVIHS